MGSNTKELFNRYFDSLDKSEDYKKKTRSQIDRPEVYEYEKKIGKNLEDFTAEDFLGLIVTFKNNRNGKLGSRTISSSTYTAIATHYRAFFNWYIDNVKIIKNPFNNPILVGSDAYSKLHEKQKPFTIDDFNDMVDRLYKIHDMDRAMYVECIARLFLEGFSNIEEIVMMKEENIDFRFGKVNLIGRSINLSSRTIMLLKTVHQMTEMQSWRTNLVFVSWHDSYFKFHVRKNEVNTFQDRTKAQVTSMISMELVNCINYKMNISISYNKLYNLGFYEYVKKLYGKEKTKEMLFSKRDREASNNLLVAANMYNYRELMNSTLIKKNLQPFVEM